MKIELYLTKINQDLILKGRPPKKPGVKWVVSWPKSCCVIGAAAAKSGRAKKMSGYLLREEKEGGMIFDPRTAAIYKVDEEAYHTIIEMEYTSDLKQLAKRMGLSINTIKTFKKRLTELGLIYE